MMAFSILHPPAVHLVSACKKVLQKPSGKGAVFVLFSDSVLEVGHLALSDPLEHIILWGEALAGPLSLVGQQAPEGQGAENQPESPPGHHGDAPFPEHVLLLFPVHPTRRIGSKNMKSSQCFMN